VILHIYNNEELTDVLLIMAGYRFAAVQCCLLLLAATALSGRLSGSSPIIGRSLHTGIVWRYAGCDSPLSLAMPS